MSGGASAAAAKRPIRYLPKRLYVKLEVDRSDPTTHAHLVADDTLESMNDGDVVGIYELHETRTMHVSRELK
jgi:hypothetical protein